MVWVWVINIFKLSISSKIYIKPVLAVYNARKKVTKTQHDTNQAFIRTTVTGSFPQNTTHTNDLRDYKVIKITQVFKLKLQIHELLKLLKTELSQVARDAGVRRGRAISGLQVWADGHTWEPQKEPLTAAHAPLRSDLKGSSSDATCALQISKLLPYRVGAVRAHLGCPHCVTPPDAAAMDIRGLAPVCMKAFASVVSTPGSITPSFTL